MPHVSSLFHNTGSDSPTTHTKDVTTHTRAMKLKHQDLKDRLEICILELKKLCIREAVSNIHLQTDQQFKMRPHKKTTLKTCHTTDESRKHGHRRASSRRCRLESNK